MTFDSGGTVSYSTTNVGGTLSSPSTGIFTGTHSVKPDSSVSISLTNEAGQAGPKFAVIVTDDGSQLLPLCPDVIVRSSSTRDRQNYLKSLVFRELLRSVSINKVDLAARLANSPTSRTTP